VLARLPEPELTALLEGYGHRPYVVAGDDPAEVHRLLAAALERALTDISAIQRQARSGERTERPLWPMIVFRTPKGWTGPAEVDGVRVEGTFRAHQVPLAGVRTDPAHLAMLEEWLRTYRPEELFDQTGRVHDDVLRLSPTGERRMSASPHANGGLLLRALELPDFRRYAVGVTTPGEPIHEPTRLLGTWLRDVIAANTDRFRIVGPDETASPVMTICRPTGGCWRCSPNTSARAGWRDIC
jgi:xylulose-5-phosphate/fructose-6-phosphate phosphoketolase